MINSPSMVSRKFVVETKGADGERGTVGGEAFDFWIFF